MEGVAAFLIQCIQWRALSNQVCGGLWKASVASNVKESVASFRICIANKRLRSFLVFEEQLDHVA